MIHKVKDSEHKFLLLTIHSNGPRQLLYMILPKIKQIQLVAQQGKWSKSGSYHKDKWEAIDRGYRTTVDKLSRGWTVPIVIDEITLEQVKQFCPAVCDIEYSTKMLEDMKIRGRL